MLAGFDKWYCEKGLDPSIDPIYPDDKNVGGYNASDCGTIKAPAVISISYTQTEADLPKKYAERQCREFLKLGLQGTTVLTASGDRGAAANSGACIDPRSGASNVTHGLFSPNFPASCPWITTVGGTKFPPTDKRWSPGTGFPAEIAYRQILSDNHTVSSSGGGFSNVFPAPFYQIGLVDDYMKKSHETSHLRNLSSSGYFNQHGRGYPDLSGLANDYLVYICGDLHKVKGTSAPTPVIAAMVALINDARFKGGKGPVGFINPALYAFRKEIMTDVVEGYNEGCGVSRAFPAAKGWDAVTGLGTPDFKKLHKLFLSFP